MTLKQLKDNNKEFFSEYRAAHDVYVSTESVYVVATKLVDNTRTFYVVTFQDGKLSTVEQVKSRYKAHKRALELSKASTYVAAGGTLEPSTNVSNGV